MYRSQKYAICTKAIPTEQNYQSCMATLLYHGDELLALQRCQLDVVKLPLTEKARTLGFGRLLITSSKDDYTLIKSAGNGSNPLARIENPGCSLCIITLGCGKQLRGPNVHLLSDLTTCDTVQAIRLDFRLPDSISTLFKLLPDWMNYQTSHQDLRHKFKFFSKFNQNSNKWKHDEQTANQ